MGKVHLTGEKETLLITLYAKASDYRSRRSILHDKKAGAIADELGIDPFKYKGFGSSLMVVRAKHYDEWVREFIKAHPDAVVVYAGCGLDTRITRIDPPSTVIWFDVDYPEVILLRRNFYQEKDGYKMLASSIISKGWVEQIPTGRPTLIITEGVLEYLSPEEVKTFFDIITDHFRHGQIIFDVMSSFAIESAKKQIKETTGATHKWAVDDSDEISKLSPQLRKREEVSIFKSRYIRLLHLKMRWIYKLMSLIPKMRDMIRLMRYEF